MHDKEQLENAGRAAAAALASQGEWIHRRVERISFPSPEEPVYRRHVSVDFTIPEDLIPVQADAAEERYYVPLSLILKWPPLLRLDLRDALDKPIPFLTGKQNAILDRAVLVALARDALGGSPAPDIAQAIDAITEEKDTADAALRDLLPSSVEPDVLAELDEARQKLRNSQVFVGTAGGLRDSTFLWLRVSGKPGDREIVKFAYDIPMEGKVRPWSAASFGFRAFIANFDSPHIGSSSSYHLTISAPAPLKVIDTEIKLRKRPQIGGEASEEVVGDCCPANSPVKKAGLTMYTEPVGDQGRFYLQGNRDQCFGEAQVALIADNSLSRNGVLAASLIAALVTAYWIRLEQVLELNEAAVTLALVAPALLAYILVRPAQNEFARSFSTGIRRTLALAGFVPILGATAIVLSGGANSEVLCDVFGGLAFTAWTLALVLFFGLILPIGKRSLPLSSYMPTEDSEDSEKEEI
jgi:hypothetical protein